MAAQTSCLSAEANEVVEFEQVGPRFDVFARLGELGHVSGEELQGFRVAVGAAPIVIVAPVLNFPSAAFVLCVGSDPLQDFPITFALL